MSIRRHGDGAPALYRQSWLVHPLGEQEVPSEDPGNRGGDAGTCLLFM
jgi:hypothetical protein